MHSLSKCLPILKKISLIRNKKEKLKLIKQHYQCLDIGLRELVSNLLNKNIKISSSKKKKLQKYKKTLRKIGSGEIKSTILADQEGSGIAGILIPIIIDLVSRYLIK